MKEQWDELRTLFDNASPLAPAERAQLLEERCNGNPRLRRELEKLLAAHDHASAPHAPPPARRFGAWEIGELLGCGAWGEVYLARRVDGHDQAGALKIIPCHLLPWDYLQRFRREREILGKLDHPAIARLLDSGFNDAGAAFVVTEFIDGKPLDQYCEAHRLNTDARLRLFLLLCSAVHIAHRSLVLHGDIKPSNVRLTADGSLKLLDFGTAQRSDPDTTLTDVHGLGLTLYCLLTRVEFEPERALPPPSRTPGIAPARSRELRGDLDNIVLQAIDPDTDRRYASAAHLADDIGRYLAGRPVEARCGKSTDRA